MDKSKKVTFQQAQPGQPPGPPGQIPAGTVVSTPLPPGVNPSQLSPHQQALLAATKTQQQQQATAPQPQPQGGAPVPPQQATAPQPQPQPAAPVPPPGGAVLDFVIPSGNDCKVQWGNKIVTVREIDTQTLLNFIMGADESRGGDFLASIMALVPVALDGMEQAEFMALKPSQQEVFMQAWRKANAVFLRGAEWLGWIKTIQKTLRHYGEIVERDLEKALPKLSEPGTNTP